MDQKELQAAMKFAELIKDLPEWIIEKSLSVTEGMAIMARDQQKTA